ncbi:hypothetical protein P7K49_014940, partial [Saguinus oedipus]
MEGCPSERGHVPPTSYVPVPGWSCLPRSRRKPSPVLVLGASSLHQPLQHNAASQMHREAAAPAGPTLGPL